VGSLVGAPAIVPYLSARQNLQLLADLHPGVRVERIGEVIERSEIADAADRASGQFSSGMKQRLGLAMALLHEPDLLVLDEPTNGMDPAGMRDVRTLLRSQAEAGTTVFLSTHMLHEVEQVCDRVAVLNSGKIMAEGPVGSLIGGEEVAKVDVPSPQRAIEVLRDLSGVKHLQGNGRRVEVGGVSAEQVVRHLTGLGIIPTQVTTSRADLEDLFLELTQETV